MNLRPGRSGHDLYGLVAHFDALGEHRTGTPVDHATTEWVADLLASDLDLEVASYDFDRFVFDTALRADGVAVEHLPLFYEGVGAVATDAPAIEAVDTFSNFVAPDLGARIEACGAPALVVATHGATDELVAFNRAPTIASGLPVVLVAGRAERSLAAAASVELSYDARVEPGRSANVVARGGSKGPHIVVTTPLTGWFTCAGERGPGIALLVDLAARLAEQAVVTVIAATGHELHHVGALAALQTAGRNLRPDAVVHLGASIATGPPVEPFTGERVQTQLPPDLEGTISDIYADADQPFAGSPDAWVSEAKEWVDRSELVLSYSGTFPLFHTPADRVAAATSSARLAEASANLDRSVAALLRHLSPRSSR